jgi:hypothetical protein
MSWSNSAVGFTIWMIMGIGFLIFEKIRKSKYKFGYSFLRFTSFSVLLWANLLLVLGDKAIGTIVVYILASFITTIMTIREWDEE